MVHWGSIDGRLGLVDVMSKDIHSPEHTRDTTAGTIHSTNESAAKDRCR